jgi:hypothetical protein
MNRILILKLILSIVVIGLSLGAILVAWSPTFLSYIPLEQMYDISEEQAKIIYEVLRAERMKQYSALESASLIIMINMVFVLGAVWFTKFSKSGNT